MRKTLMLMTVGLVLAIGAVAAQQPPATPPTPAAKPADKTDKAPDKTAAVLAALKGNGPAVAEPAPADTAPSLNAVLDRYARMAAAGQQTPAAVTVPATRATTARPTAPRAADDTPMMPITAAPSTTTATPGSSDTLDAIRADLRALLSRLDALAHKDGGQ